jgi:hypothetical protein
MMASGESELFLGTVDLWARRRGAAVRTRFVKEANAAVGGAERDQFFADQMQRIGVFSTDCISNTVF